MKNITVPLRFLGLSAVEIKALMILQFRCVRNLKVALKCNIVFQALELLVIPRIACHNIVYM